MTLRASGISLFPMIDNAAALFRHILGEASRDITGFDFGAFGEAGVEGRLARLYRLLSDGTSGLPPKTFPERCAAAARREISGLAASNPDFSVRLSDVLGAGGRAEAEGNDRRRERLWELLFPEGAGLMDAREKTVRTIRARRKVKITRMNPDPVTDPVNEILFTSNVLLTVPDRFVGVDDLDLPDVLKNKIRAACLEPQRFFYDHPIHIGVPVEANEAVYGLRGLNSAVACEKAGSRAGPDDKAAVVLSLSVTHTGLHEVAADYLRSELEKAGPFEHLAVYLFTEPDCRRIIDDILAPFMTPGGKASVPDVFGVDGEYGRHYSFLKAVAAFWQVFVNPALKGTFKIDLDQVFPQDVLEWETGMSAFGHLCTPLWGALGTDAEGSAVDLGMIAGALVNEKDICRGLFTPDVTLPDFVPRGEAAVFYNRVPMALSTEAEMMLRYGNDGEPDGSTSCSQRFHVTGGTNGILVGGLRRHRPFTPSFIGRAEDQAYILSVLYNESAPVLRYAHKPGLVMRHDKEAFAGASIENARLGRFAGDLARTWLFSRYAEALPWGIDRIKAQIDPFTGCFATPLPWTLIVLRLALKCAEIFVAGGEQEAAELLSLADDRLSPFLDADEGKAPGIRERYEREKAAWDRYYDALDRAEAGDDSLRPAAAELAESCRIV